MTSDKRNREKAVPDNIRDVLNDDQLYGLKKIESFGWDLKFVRRPLFLEPIAVVGGPDNDAYAILEDDGDINLELGDLSIRKTEVESKPQA